MRDLVIAVLIGLGSVSILAQANSQDVGMVVNSCPAPAPGPPAQVKAATNRDMFEPGQTFSMPSGNENSRKARQAALEEQRLKDWAQLCTYRSQNGSLKEVVNEVFFGDSITEFWIAAEPDFFSGARLDRGISGQTSPQLLIRFYQDVVQLHPKVVHILSGTNDVAGNTGPTTAKDFENNILAMLDIASANNIRVVIGSLTPSSRFWWRTEIKPVANIRELNAWLRELCKRRRISFVDYYSAMATSDGSFDERFSNDGVHPNRAGYKVMEALAERGLRASINRKSTSRSVR